jgi:SAM-dependent methyltransferase
MPIDAHAAFRLHGLVSALRDGARVSDRDFDAALFPIAARRRSSTFWTPVEVARRAIELLVVTGGTRVLDVGSGVGKFCIVGSALTGAMFLGIEQRARLVDIANEAASRARATSACFVHGDFSNVDIAAFDAIYLFNPFEENAWPRDEWLDDTVTMSLRKAHTDVVRMEQMLERARTGTRVVTYHGFGGDMPPAWVRLLRERSHTGDLELWIKSS